jgi:hypothetical protein
MSAANKFDATEHPGTEQQFWRGAAFTARPGGAISC